ncbi:hypothetical protein NM688_g4506 [Phlebia brevispora]|uniref:Uncharacterized protein n=1 Tax=Phlebia brevispora TaxID=194682 RepID=A0ACC1T2P3_9APHY|nr:hypothetical protein NM688_g4506 [Phlebia brevispora]
MFGKDPETLPPLARAMHAGHCLRCIQGLPAASVEADASSLGSLDILGLIESKTKEAERGAWRRWLWTQQSRGPFGTGFKGSSYMTPDLKGDDPTQDEYTEYDTPNLIMSYTTMLSLAILRDDFSELDRPGLIQFLKSCQCEDGSFSPLPNGGEADLRSVYCAFAISNMLGDWSGIDIPRTLNYIEACISHEGGFAQTPFAEAIGGTTYCALASLALLPLTLPLGNRTFTSPVQREQTIRWLLQNQTVEGGFCGRTNKLADACYCFWCAASLQLLGAEDMVDTLAMANFLASCQFKFGGVCKEPGGRPDPYHTYMTLAALSICPVKDADNSWKLPTLDVALNTTVETAKWIQEHVPEKQRIQ